MASPSDLDRALADPAWWRLAALDDAGLEALVTEPGSGATATRCRQRAAWLLERRRGEPGETAHAPAGFPVLTSGQQGEGGLGFIQVAEGAAAAADPSWHAALQATTDWWATLGQPRPPLGVVTTELPAHCHGASLGLSLLLAALARVARVTWPPDLAASAQIVLVNRRPALAPVEHLAAKAACARRNGYRRILVAAGQETPAVPGITWIPLPAKLDACLLELLPLASGPGVIDLLACLDAAARDGRLGRFPAGSPQAATVLAFDHNDQDPATRCLARSILAQSRLHAGDPAALADAQAASEYRMTAIGNHHPHPRAHPHIRFHVPAELGIAALDAGHWDEHPVWASLANLAERYDHDEADIHERFGRLAAANTLARRDGYRARLSDDRAGLRRAWERLHPATDRGANAAICAHAQAIGKGDTTPHRQWNTCLDQYLAWWDLTGSPPDWDLASCWACDSEAAWEGPYDPTYHLAVAAALGLPLAHRLAEAVARERPPEQGLTYPGSLISERLIRHGAHWPEAATAAAERLHAALAATRPGSHHRQGTSILSLLRIRSWAVCEQARRSGLLSAAESPFPLPDPDTPWTAPLAAIAERLLPKAHRHHPSDADLAACIRRCPY